MSRRRSARPLRRNYPTLSLAFESLEERRVFATWTQLANPAPTSLGTMLLQSDGTVLAQGSNETNQWFKLTPDSQGSYVNGSWAPASSMALTRLYHASNVLPDGRVMVLGGDFSSTGFTTRTGEIYDSRTNVWTALANFPQIQYGRGQAVLLPSGKVLAGSPFDTSCYLYDPSTNTWTVTGSRIHNESNREGSWTLLPDGDVLSYDVFTSVSTGIQQAQRYDFDTGTWLDAGTPPAPLTTAAIGFEIGAAIRLMDGRIFQMGGNSNTALYDPTTNTWTAGPSLPAGLGDAASAAIMPNGHVVFTANTPRHIAPTRMLEYDPLANTITDITSSLPGALQTNLSGLQTYRGRMLMLPTGEVLYSPDFSGVSRAYIYAADGTAPVALRPIVSSVAVTGTNVYTLTGKQLTGQSAGAANGDDAQMDTNYPIVQLTAADGSNRVFYARTFNWTPGVATGNAEVTTQFELPAGVPEGAYDLRVIASGIASAPVPFNAPASLAVLSSSPEAGTDINTAPTSFPVTFNEAVLASSLQASDLTVNGIAADGVTLDPTGKVATFPFTSSPVVNQGMQSLSLAANAITGTNGKGNWAYTIPFRYDAVKLAVVSTVPSVTESFVIPAATFTYDVTFNEPVDPTKVAPSNLTLSQGSVLSAVPLPGNTTVRYTLTGLGQFGVSVAIPPGRLVDQFGNPGFSMFSRGYSVNPAIGVTGTTPAVGSVVNTPPTTFTINFDRSIAPTSVQASDLRVNGIAATSAGMFSSTSVVFFFPTSPVTTQGLQNISMVAGAMVGGSSTPTAAFDGSFRYDAAPLSINSVVPTSGSALTLPGPLTVDVTFSEPVDASTIQIGDFQWSGMTGVSTSQVSLLPGNQTARVTVIGPTVEGTVTLNVPTGTIQDAFGNPGQIAYSTSLPVDSVVQPFAGAFTGTAPAGSLIYDAQSTGIINYTSDNDFHTLTLDAGQALTVSVIANSATLQPQVDVLDSNDAVIGSNVAAGAGATAVLQTVALTGGSYSIRVKSVAGTVGSYTMRATLNAAIESENSGGAANDSIAAAQSIDGSMLLLDAERGVRRGAVVGGNSTGSWSDYYALTATSPDTLSLALKNLTGSGTSLQLKDASGNVLASAGAMGTNFDLGLSNFQLPTSGIYYLHVVGSSSATYSLTIATNAAFNVDADSASSAISMATGGALGSLGMTALGDLEDWYTVTLETGQSTLDLFTSTPGDGAGDFNNTLNAKIELYDTAGTVLLARSLPLGDGRNEALNATGLTAGIPYKIKVTLEANSRGEYVLHRLPSLIAPVDIVVGQFTGTGDGTVSITYQVNNVPATPFRIGFYSSSNANFESSADEILNSWNVTSAADLAVGTHTLTFALGSGPGQLALPGAGLDMPGKDFYLLAVADDTAIMNESTVGNNASAFSGAYHITRGTVVVMGTDGDNNITVSGTTQLQLTIDGLAMSYPLTDVIAFDFFPHAGNDLVDGANVSRPMNFFASPGTDTFGGGTSGSTVIGTVGNNNWKLTASNAGRIGETTFSRIGNLTGGPSADTFEIVLGGSLSGTIQGSTGINTLDYSSFTTAVSVNLAAQTATGLTRPYFNINRVRGGSGNNVLTATNATNVWLIDGLNSGTLNAGQFNEVGFTNFSILNGGSAVDYFVMRQTGRASKVDGKLGNDELSYLNYGAASTVNLQNKTATGLTSGWASIESASGSGLGDTLIGANVATVWDLLNTNIGLAGTFSYNAYPNLVGGTAADTFRFRNGARVTGSVDGKAGINTLDYSLLSSNVVVNLQMSKATNVLGSIANIRNIVGGQADDILVGDAAANSIAGGGGRNIIIGRAGADTLTGGSDGDILIGGRTSYDTIDAALAMLMAVWGDRNRSYSARVSDIQNGVNYMNAGVPQRAALVSTNVFDDQAVDTLNGGAGTDWYFARLTGSLRDTVNNRAFDEALTSF